MGTRTRSHIGMFVLSMLLLGIFPIESDEEHFVVDNELFTYIDVLVQVPPPVSILFVGDIMLGRQVERIMEAEGMEYPFTNILALLKDADLTVGNFEGVVGKTHIPTPSMGFQFSIKDEYLSYLSEIGFDVLSLANNHSLDLGIEGLTNTRARCEELLMTCGGRPRILDAWSTTTVSVGSTTIGFLFAENVLSEIDMDVVASSTVPLLTESDFQIAYIHWGNEYERIHSSSQEDIATRLIDLGYDAVIGHHPHVVQDIQIYNGKPIFYSLGNFIFDQYFSNDVQEGIALTLTLDEAYATYTIVPLSSTSTRSQPNIMSLEAAAPLRTRIFEHASTTEG